MNAASVYSFSRGLALTGICSHYLPSAFTLSALMVVIALQSWKSLGASTSLIGTLNPTHTSIIVSLKSLQVSCHCGIIFLCDLNYWLFDYWSWYCLTEQLPRHTSQVFNLMIKAVSTKENWICSLMILAPANSRALVIIRIIR